MDTEWHETFRKRMHHFEGRHAREAGGVAVSIKIRVTTGCFHWEHSPRAYAIIDRYIRTAHDAKFEYIEHESGPELLVYLVIGTAGLTLAKSIIDLIITIIKARSEGVRKGDRPSDPLELIVRRLDERAGFQEELVLRISHADPIDEVIIEARMRPKVKGPRMTIRTKGARSGGRRGRCRLATHA